MTRDKAIKRLKELRSGNWWAFEDPNEIDITNVALDMAIEALSPRRREDATEEDYAYCDDCEAVEMCMWYPYDGCIFKIQSRPKGEWILVKGSNGKDYHKCSKCLHTQEITGVKNYCAVCGARMESEKEYLDKTFPEHEGGEWFDITDMMTGESKDE